MQQDKQQVMKQWLEKGWVSVLLNPRIEGVILPNSLRDNVHLVLQYGYNMPIPMPDLKVDETGITATLSFRHVPCFTFVPWSAVFALTDGEQQLRIWASEVPDDLDMLPSGSSLQRTSLPESETTSIKTSRRHLKLV